MAETVKADLFASMPAAPGKTDTSHEAADALKNLKGKRLEVYDTIVRFSGRVTPSDIAYITGMSILTVRPRVTELRDLGLIEDTGRRTKNDNGRNEIIWKIKE